MIDNCPNPSLFNIEIPNLENGKHAPRLGDIWICGSVEIDQHYVRFYLPRMESIV